MMNIIINPLSALVKKGLSHAGFAPKVKKEKSEKPLVENEQNSLNENKLNEKSSVLEDSSIGLDEESKGSDQYYVLQSRARRLNSATTTLCIFLTVLLVISIGVVSGIYLFQKYSKSHNLRHFRGWCKIPYPQIQAGFINKESDSTSLGLRFFPHNNEQRKLIARSFFQEQFEIDTETEKFEKVEVPNFGVGRRGRFIHDFNMNKTGIVDLDNGRCFVMALDRKYIIPPRNLHELIKKMWNGYVEVNTGLVRRTMRVMRPAVTDFSTIGFYISQECHGIPTYRLEKVMMPVYKRSTDNREMNNDFFMFAGASILDLRILNIDDDFLND